MEFLSGAYHHGREEGKKQRKEKQTLQNILRYFRSVPSTILRLSRLPWITVTSPVQVKNLLINLHAYIAASSSFSGQFPEELPMPLISE